MWIWCRCSDCRNPGDARYSGKLAAMGTGDTDRRYGSPLSRVLVKLCACLGYVGLVCVVFTPCRLSQISCFTPGQPQMPPFSVPTNCSDVGISPLLQLPHPQVPVRSCSLSSFSFPSFILLSFVWAYIFLSAG